MPSAIELNVTPFIDIFSLLCTFLLFSAVFIRLGIIEVQVPFLSRAESLKKIDDVEPTLDPVRIYLSNEKIEIQATYAAKKQNILLQTYDNSAQGRLDFYQDIKQLKTDHPTQDRADIYPEGDISFKDLITILDLIRLDQLFPKSKGIRDKKQSSDEPLDDQKEDRFYLFDKVVFANIDA